MSDLSVLLPRLRAYVRRRFISEAEDVVAETLLATAIKARAGARGAALEAFAVTVARHRIVDRLRRNNLAYRTREAIARHKGVAAPSVLDELVRIEEREEAFRICDNSPDPELARTWKSGATDEQLARAFGITVKALNARKKRLVRAILKQGAA